MAEIITLRLRIFFIFSIWRLSMAEPAAVWQTGISAGTMFKKIRQNIKIEYRTLN